MKKYIAIPLLLALISLAAIADDTIPPYVGILWPDSGAYVSCDHVIIEMLIVDRDFFVDRGSILLTVNNFPHWLHAIDESTFSFVDSFYYFPIHRPIFDGDSIWCLMSPIADFDDNYSDAFNWFFYIDFSGPEITDLIPSPESEIADPHANISAVVFDPAGLTEDSCFITFDGDSFDLFEGYAAWHGDTFVFYSGLAGLFFPGGDTVEVCVYAADAAEGCGVNRSDTCWQFSIPVGGPTAELLWPFEGAWLSCPDTNVVFRIEDSDGVEPDSIYIATTVGDFFVADPELSWSEPFLFWDISGIPEGAIAGTLYAADVLGNLMEPPLGFSLGIDISPPVLESEYPPAGSAILDLDPVVTFDLIDYLAGMMHGPTLAGISVDGSSMSWFSLSSTEFSVAGFSYTLDSLAIPPLHGGDTVTIRVIAFDSVNVCEVNRVDTSWFFYIPWSPPEVELILPESDIVSACSDQRIIFLITDDEGIVESSIRLELLGDIYDLGDPELTFSGDSLYFTPVSPWAHGAYISGGLIYVEDILGNAIVSSVPFGFFIDLESPEIVSFAPPEFSLSADTLREVVTRIEDSPAGLDTASVQVTVDGFPYIIDGTNLRWEDPYLIFDPAHSGGWNRVDTVVFCLISASDLPDTCDPNTSEPFCWTFFIDGRDPYATPPEGAIVACTLQDVRLYLWAPGGIIDSTVLLDINGILYTTEDPRLVMLADTLIFSPDIPWIDGDSVRCLLVHAEGALGSSIDSVYWGFLMDYSRPVLISADPSPGEVVDRLDPDVNFVLVDSVSGLLHAAFELTINGSSFGWDHPALTVVGDSFSFDTRSALHLAGGDSAEVCIHGEDLAYPDYCGPNILDTCYSFTIESGGPTASLLSPPESTAYACDSLIIIIIEDHNGVRWPTLQIEISGEVLYYGDSRLSIFGDTLIIDYDPTSGETLDIALLALEDSLENPCSLTGWTVVFDFDPPVVEWLFPSTDTTLTTTSPAAVARIYDVIGEAYSELPGGESFTISGDTITISPAGIADYDTLDICVEVHDSAICPNIAISCLHFYIDAAPPVADLIIPDDSTSTACDPQTVVILLSDPSGITPFGLVAVFGVDTVDLGDPRLRLLGDSLVFEPDTAFPPGEVFVSIISIADRWGNELAGFETAFYQITAPAIIDVSPAPGASSSSVSPDISVSFELSDSGFIVIEEDTFGIGDAGFSFFDDSLIFSTETAALSWSAGDTVEICAYAMRSADYCGPAVAETYWSFYILYSPPTWLWDYPACSTWTACTLGGASLTISDDEGIDSASILFSADGETLDIFDDRLSYEPSTDELIFIPTTNWDSDTIRFCLLALADILGAEAGDLPFCCKQYLDIEPPEITFDPPPGTYLPIPIVPFDITILDAGSGSRPESVSVEGIWVTTSDDELDWISPIATFDLWPLIADSIPETITICVHASDMVDYCGPNDTIVCVDYPVNTTAPILNMLFPGNGVITSCIDGPLVFSAVDPDMFDSISVSLVLDGSTIDSLDPRFQFPTDSTIVFTPDTSWLHGAVVCGTLIAADTLGSLSEPYSFCITIDSEPPIVSNFFPPTAVLDTFRHISFVAQDSPAGVDRSSPVITVADDTVEYLWLGDTLIIDRDDLGLCEFDTVGIVIHNLADNAAACGQNVMPDTLWDFIILDDDTLPPEIISISPGYAFSGIEFAVTAEIWDTSGVDSNSVILYWNEGDSLSSTPDSIIMQLISGDIWAAVSGIGPVEGEMVSVAICASDNDYDCENPLDRSMGCDTFYIPLDPLGLVQIPIDHGAWNPEWLDEPVCAGEEYRSRVAFFNPDTFLLFADSISTIPGDIITVETWNDTALFPGETLFVTLVLFAETEGEYAETLFVLDDRLSYPIGVDTVYALVQFCDFLAGPNPISPNGDGYYDEFRIELPRGGNVEISFYRLEGMHVATLRGDGRIYSWDGTDDHGCPQPPGIYLWVVRLDGEMFEHGSVTIAR